MIIEKRKVCICNKDGKPLFFNLWMTPNEIRKKRALGMNIIPQVDD